jgi:Tol biopolymer transport system component
MRNLTSWIVSARITACVTVAGLCGALGVQAAPITVAQDGTHANGPSAEPRSTPDGRFIVYSSAASNLTALDTGDGVNVYVTDRALGVTSIVSISQSPGADILGDGPSMSPDISDDGRYVVFQSTATNLVAGDTEGRSDIFLYNRVTGDLQRLTTGVSGDNASPRISGDGRMIVFQSDGRLVTEDTNTLTDIYRIHRESGAIALISRGQAGSPSNGHSRSPAINQDGSMVAFESDASNLAPEDRNNATDVFVADLGRNLVKLVSAPDPAVSFEAVGGERAPRSGNGPSGQPAISGDGRWVVFSSDATDLAPDDRNAMRDIFVCDGETGSVELVSRNFFGDQANGPCERPDISEHGRIVGFESDATNLTMFDDNGIRDVFTVELETGQVARVSAPASEEMENASGFGMISVGASGNGEPEVFGELPGGFDDTGPGDPDDGMIIPGVCNIVPRCGATDSTNSPVTMIAVDPGEEVLFTMTTSTLCISRILTLDLVPGDTLPTGAVQIPALPRTGVPNARVSSVFLWTPTSLDTGLHPIRYMGVDNLGRIGTCTINVAVGACDGLPLCDVDYTGPTTVEAGAPVSFTLTAQAFCDDLPVLVEAIELPTGATTMPALPASSIAGEPLVIRVDWTPMIGDVGQPGVFRFRSNEAFNKTSECGLTLDVVGPMCDNDPICEISGPMVVNASPGDTITFDVTGSTPCPQGLTLDAVSIPAGATLTPMTPVTGAPGESVTTRFSWTPTADDFGSHMATFTVTDDLNRVSNCGVSIEVGACENTPICETPDGDDFIVFMNESVTFTVRGESDCSGAILTLDSDSIPNGAVILEGLPLVGAPGQSVVATFQWTPGIDGLFTVGFTVTDQTGRSSMCSVDVSVVDCDLLPVLTLDPDGAFLVAPGDFVTFSALGTTDCPKTGLLMAFDNVPDGAQIIPDPVLMSGPNEDVGAIFEWTPASSDAGGEFTVSITLTDSFGRSVNDSVAISVLTVCAEVEVNNTPEEANVIDADCVYISGKLQKNPFIACEADTYLTLFNKANAIINRDDNGSPVGNGWASGLTDLGIRNDTAPKPFGDGGDGLINNGDGSFGVRIGVTGRPDGLDGVFNGLFLNSAHGQLGAFRLTVTFKNINGALIVPIGFPPSAHLENPVIYDGEFVTGAEAFRINYTAPLGTARVDIQIDNLIENTTICNDVDFFLIRGLVPLCDYCITQVGGIDCECRPTDLNLGWFDKLGNIIDTDDNSGPVQGYADLCVVADANGRALIGVTGTGDDDFNGLADAWEDASGRAPAECNEPPHAHGVCGCYTLCIMVTGPHGGSSPAATLEDPRVNGDLNMDGRVDAADLAILLGFMSAH